MADAGGDDVETWSTRVVTMWRHGGRHRGNELVVDVVCRGCIMCTVMGMRYLVEDCGEVRGHGGEVVALVTRHKGTYITCWSEITINTSCPKINMYKLPNCLETVGIHIRITAVCIIQGMRLFILKKNKCLVNSISPSILHRMI